MLRHLAMLALAAGGFRCQGGATGPDTPATISIRLEVTGGIASAHFGYTIDGAAGVVRGELCQRLCDWQPGEILGSVSGEQVRALAARFEDSGFFALPRTDYGSGGCCDQQDYTLSYRDGRRDRTVRGNDFTLPAPVLELVHAVRQTALEATGRRGG
jgi:hypothetical protein